MERPFDAGPANAPACWRFAHVRFDEARGLLCVRGHEVELDRSNQALLAHFLRHPGELVHKDTLLEIGWSGRIVAENTLAKAISRLRHLIGDDDGELIRVVHGYGYRLMADVENEHPARAPVAAPPASLVARLADVLCVMAVLALVIGGFVRLPASPGAVQAAQLAVPAAGSIAVLPFADLSPKGDQAYFADGLAEELLDNLARLSQLRVASRTSSFALRDSSTDIRAIGRSLGVRHVLEGSVRSSEDRIRVTVQLIDARTGFHTWSQTYDRPISELFAMQDEIVSRIVEAMRVQLAPEDLRAVAHHGTRNPEAFRQYLYARSIYDYDDTNGRRALVAMRRAVALDPDFIEAWLALANHLSYDAVYPDSREEVRANKREALAIMERLIRMRPRQAKLYLQRGDMLFWHWRDMAGAEQDFERAAQLVDLREDDEWMVKMSRVYAATGRMPQALDMTAKATRDPMSNAWVVRAYHLLGAGLHEEARDAAQQALRRQPRSEHAHYYLGLCDLLQGRPREAMTHFDDTTHHFRLAGMAMAEYTLGNHVASDRHLQWLATRYGHVAPYLVADVHAWRGENDQAYAWMQRSLDVHEGSLMYLAFDPLIAPLRKDARWPGLLRQVRLDRYLLPAARS